MSVGRKIAAELLNGPGYPSAHDLTDTYRSIALKISQVLKGSLPHHSWRTHHNWDMLGRPYLDVHAQRSPETPVWPLHPNSVSKGAGAPHLGLPGAIWNPAADHMEL